MESHGYPMCIHASEATNKAAQAVAADENYVPDKILLVPPFAAEVRRYSDEVAVLFCGSDHAPCNRMQCLPPELCASKADAHAPCCSIVPSCQRGVLLTVVL
eukprot:1161187-Pelagomonas_calceolata.AAC.7